MKNHPIIKKIFFGQLQPGESLHLPGGTFEIFGVSGTGKMWHKTSHTNDWVLLDGWYVGGLHQNSFQTKVEGEICYATIQFHTEVMHQFCSEALINFKNRTVPLHEFFDAKHPWRKLASMCPASADDLLQFFEDSLVPSARQEKLAVKLAIKIIHQRLATINVEQLAFALCISRPHLRRIFYNYVGLSPYQFIQTIRISQALNQCLEVGKPKLTQVAYHYGYYDQSHFINECKRMTQLSPRQFRANKLMNEISNFR